MVSTMAEIIKSKVTAKEIYPAHKHTIKKSSGIISRRTIIKLIRKMITQKKLSFDKSEVTFFNIKSLLFLYYTIVI